MNKKLKSIIMLAVMFIASASIFAASKKSIVCTTFPEYDWIMNILGEKKSSFDVTLLQNNGADLHSYQPSIKDIAKISKSDMFVYVGGESDKWVNKVLEQSVNKNQIAVNMMKILGEKVREEEVVEGMQVAHDHEHEHADHDHHHEDADHDHHDHEHAGHDHHDHEHAGHDHHHEVEYDEHIWLSIQNAIELTRYLSVQICTLDAVNSSVYEKNTVSYVNELSKLNENFKDTVKKSKKKYLLFGDRYPFRYLTDDYGIKYYAAFVGCSAESEASFETVVFLANKVDELDLNVILTIEKSNKKIANTILKSTKKQNQQIMELDSLQSVTSDDIKSGRSYLSAMKKNLEVIKQALN